MNLLSKILLTSISFLVFIFLIFVTYVVSSYGSFEKPFYEKINTGDFGLLENPDGSMKIGNITESTNIYINKISTSSKVVFSSGSVNTNTNSGNTYISITPGLYYFDLREINSNYIVTGSGFEVDGKGPGSFFINTLNPKKNIIFSLDNIIELNLKNYKTSEDITTVDLYPHTYLLFNPLKNIFVKNSDLLKISQTFNLGYFNDSVIDNSIINEKIVELITLKQESIYDFVKKCIRLKQDELSAKKIVLDKFIGSSFGVLAGENLIEGYASFLKNPKKKSLYYKNLIIRNLNVLISNDAIDNESTSNIIKYLEILKDIDKGDHDEMSEIIKYYYDALLKSNPSINSKINISKLIYKINNPNLSIAYKYVSLLHLEKTFYEYNFLINPNFYKEIANFREKYIKEQSVFSQKESDKDSEYKNIKNIDYLLFFLENILISDFSGSEEYTEELIQIFNEYVKLANLFYSNNDEKIKRTGIFKYAKILSKFSEILKDNYFLESRDGNNLLILNEKNILQIKKATELEDNINQILSFYHDFKSYLNPNSNNKDKFIMKQYSSLEKSFEEFFLAIKDYESYATNYNEIKIKYIKTETVNEGGDDIVLSEKNGIEYLAQFNGLQISKIKTNIMDYSYCVDPIPQNEKATVETPYCYKVENLFIDSNNVSFLLFPFEGNQIEEITVNGVEKSASYKLDDIKVKLAEKMKAESKEKDKYEFANFLVDTFGRKVYSPVNVENPDDSVKTIDYEEDPVVKIFKRNKLLGSEGEFAHLDGFLNINYSDLIVKIVNEGFSIEVVGAIFDTIHGRNKTYYGELSSKYIFTPDHSFINPKIKFIDKKNEKDLLIGNYVYITGHYKVDTIKTEIIDLFEKYDQVNYIVNSISQILRNNEVSINYYKNTKTIVLDTVYDSKKIKITLNNSEITGLSIDGVNRLGYNMSYSQIKNLLNNIK